MTGCSVRGVAERLLVEPDGRRRHGRLSCVPVRFVPLYVSVSGHHLDYSTGNDRWKIAKNVIACDAIGRNEAGKRFSSKIRSAYD